MGNPGPASLRFIAVGFGTAEYFQRRRKEKRRIYLLRDQWTLIGKVYGYGLSIVFEIGTCGGGDGILPS